MTGPAEHPLREQLVAELHSRPHAEARPPARISHLALLTGETGAEVERAHLAKLCRRYSALSPPDDATHHSAQLGELRLRWERHTEFSTYTFLRDGPIEVPFSDPALALVPQPWLAGLPGELLAACHLALEPGDRPERDAAELARLFEGQHLVGSRVQDGAARVWTTFRTHGDGFARYLVRADTLAPERTGRLVQRLVELDTYRMAALLALPVARALAPTITRMEQELARLAAETARTKEPDAERDMLDALTRLAAETERLIADHAYRFGAARAYAALVEGRVRALREARLDGMQQIGQFLSRRFTPAMATCQSVENRLDSLSRRIGRTADLLRTRVDVQLQAQNQRLLASFDRRAKLQLRLQETVEGLSVVAISYYALSLLALVLKGLPLTEGVGAVLLAGAVPVTVLALYLGLRRLRRRLRRDE